MAVPDAVLYKIVRAHEHLKEFEAELGRYYETNPAKMVRQSEGTPDQYIGKVVAHEPIPARLPVIIGDCLQNLRSSLDYLVWELVLAANQQPSDSNMFPICTTPEAFVAQCKRRRLNGVPVDAIAEIQGLQPYRHGQDASKDMLAVIDNLCNINKHRRVLDTHLHAGIAPDDLATQDINGQRWAHIDLGATLNQEAKVGPFPIVDGPEGPGLQMDVKPHFLAFVSFSEGPAQDMHVGVIVGEMVKYIYHTVLPRFERFFT